MIGLVALLDVGNIRLLSPSILRDALLLLPEGIFVIEILLQSIRRISIQRDPIQSENFKSYCKT